MIRIFKDMDNVPLPLRTDEEGLKLKPAQTTNNYRKLVIQKQAYPSSTSSKQFDDCYKHDEIKAHLKSIYHGKCAYCETLVEQLHVEHFRPKRGGYYWLAYSWDNLLLACPTCNTSKKNGFPIKNTKVEFEENRDKLELINRMSSVYDLIEAPLLINPETVSEELLNTVTFDKNGGMSSTDERMDKTIETCNLDRRALRDQRQKIWDDLKLEIEFAIVESDGDEEKFSFLVEHVLGVFKTKSMDPKEPYISYRKFILESGWIKDLLIRPSNLSTTE